MNNILHGSNINDGNFMRTGGIYGLTVNNVNNYGAGTAVMRSRTGKAKYKKHVNYNPREISGQILRAGKPGNAARVLSRAKTKVSTLRRCKATGQYDEAELNAALAHAQRLVKCARIKVKNLKQEERNAKKNERENETKKNLRRFEIRKKLNEEKRKKYSHRNDERRRVSEADMRYYSDRMKGLSGDSVRGSYNGVSLELSHTAVGLSELKMNEQAMHLLEQQEQNLQAELDAESMQMSGQMAVEPGMAGTAGGMVIDVSV